MLGLSMFHLFHSSHTGRARSRLPFAMVQCLADLEDTTLCLPLVPVGANKG